MHLQLNLSVSHPRWSASSCSLRTLEKRWQQPEERLQELTQNLIDTRRRRLTLWLTFCSRRNENTHTCSWHYWQRISSLTLWLTFCSRRNENTPTCSWHYWQRISSLCLPLKRTLRESSQSAETCAAINDSEPQSAYCFGTSCVLENEQETCICIAVDWYVDLCLCEQ